MIVVVSTDLRPRRMLASLLVTREIVYHGLCSLLSAIHLCLAGHQESGLGGARHGMRHGTNWVVGYRGWRIGISRVDFTLGGSFTMKQVVMTSSTMLA